MSDKKVYTLSPVQWKALRTLAESYPVGSRLPRITANALLSRGLAEVKSGVVISELGMRVFSRLNAGPKCQVCEKPIAFVRRVNVGKDKNLCEPCAKPKVKEDI